ncbi:uncharacterized protein MYCFIDRAFT_173121 [Pseudocercospora fijiensis CIRAD86]|uniref:Uncharacterized protein n=1 Tax=Pseudocercospora fijiensis (strain CIRAD86) TaxID=383855 RepID=M2Z2J6_PSEFD|nr:uncharacterized protein MYCFIDRAFT_173121 [Pseudocercospora fijiensis CIRAD86]EME84070.1 hypothetical protein MYCFIDRAFT_173121 [Pseudocercospora fijiensis CIRAD86]
MFCLRACVVCDANSSAFVRERSRRPYSARFALGYGYGYGFPRNADNAALWVSCPKSTSGVVNALAC